MYLVRRKRSQSSLHLILHGKVIGHPFFPTRANRSNGPAFLCKRPSHRSKSQASVVLDVSASSVCTWTFRHVQKPLGSSRYQLIHHMQLMQAFVDSQLGQGHQQRIWMSQKVLYGFAITNESRSSSKGSYSLQGKLPIWWVLF